MKRPLTVFLPLLLSLFLLILLSSCIPDDPPAYIDCDIQALVDAIDDANADPDQTTIELSPDCNYIVDQVYADPHPIQGNIASGLPLITTDLIILGNEATITGPFGLVSQRYRLFFIEEGVTASFSNMTIVNGHLYVGSSRDVFQGYGGAILNLGDLTVRNMRFYGNKSHTGGAIANQGDGRLTVVDSTFVGNDGYFEAGAINNDGSGGATVEGSVFSENTSNVPANMSMGGMGAAISTQSDMEITTSIFDNNVTSATSGVIATFGSADVIIEGCSFTNNNADYHGVVLKNTGNVSVINSTFSGNISTNGNLWIIHSTSGSASVSHTTIANNISESPAVYAENSTLIISNSIIANNSGGDCDPSLNLIAEGNNLDSDGSCSGFITTDPLLEPLADNGGGTLTHALDPSSPAIDLAASACPAADQRGMTRPQSFFCDLGAYEAEEVESCSINYLVNAINYANSDPDPTTIELDPGCTYVVDQQYGDRQSGLPGLLTDITILGNEAIITRPGLEEQPDEYRLFYIESGVQVSISDLTLSSGVITGAEGVNDDSDSHGGAIFNRGDLTLMGVTIQDNQAVSGGAIYNQSNLTLSGSSLFANDSSQGGGGVFNLGEAEIVGCALWRNSASLSGGSALHNQSGTLSVFNSTLSGNQAGPGNLYTVFNGGGLIRISYSTVTAAEGGAAALGGGSNLDSYRYDVISSIIANNPPGDCAPGISINVYGNNLDSDGSCLGFSHTGDPLLESLGDNGGGTWTHAVPMDSPALNAASGECPIIDQRGVSRPQGSACDLGAYEYDGIQPSPSPTPEVDPCLFEALQNTNCRASDCTAADFIASLPMGESALLIGMTSSKVYGLFELPAGETCWMPFRLLTGGDILACNPVIAIPPPCPTPLVCTPTLGPEDCKKAGGTPDINGFVPCICP